MNDNGHRRTTIPRPRWSKRSTPHGRLYGAETIRSFGTGHFIESIDPNPHDLTPWTATKLASFYDDLGEIQEPAENESSLKPGRVDYFDLFHGDRLGKIQRNQAKQRTVKKQRKRL